MITKKITAGPPAPPPIVPFITFGGLGMGGGRVMVVTGKLPDGKIQTDDPFHPAGTYPVVRAPEDVHAVGGGYVLSEYKRLKIEPPEGVELWLDWPRDRALAYQAPK